MLTTSVVEPVVHNWVAVKTGDGVVLDAEVVASVRRCVYEGVIAVEKCEVVKSTTEGPA